MKGDLEEYTRDISRKRIKYKFINLMVPRSTSIKSFFSVVITFSFQVVAVKQLDRDGLQGNREFLSEVLTLSLVHHPNLVNLTGYCADGQQRILVYEFMCNGSLEHHLLGNSPVL